MKPLFLILIGQWFDMIYNNEKTEEYRDITPYWIKRLTNDFLHEIDEDGERFTFTPKPFLWVHFRHGYNSKNRQCLREIQSITVGEGRPEWGAIPGKKYFVIKLGERDSTV